MWNCEEILLRVRHVRRKIPSLPFEMVGAADTKHDEHVHQCNMDQLCPSLHKSSSILQCRSGWSWSFVVWGICLWNSDWSSCHLAGWAIWTKVTKWNIDINSREKVFCSTDTLCWEALQSHYLGQQWKQFHRYLESMSIWMVLTTGWLWLAKLWLEWPIHSHFAYQQKYVIAPDIHFQQFEHLLLFRSVRIGFLTMSALLPLAWALSHLCWE